MDLTSGSVLKKMILFSAPLIFSSILQLLFNTADVIVVGRFAGDDSLAAVGSNGAVVGLITNLFVGFSVGANVVAARAFGAGKGKDLSETVHTAMLLSAVSGVVLTVIGFFGAKYILIWMLTPESVLPLATLYLQIYFLGMTAMMVYNFGSAILRAVGDTRRPFLFLFIGGCINVALNLLFVIVFKMDVAGVAIATVVSQCVSAALTVRCLVKEKGDFRLELKKLRVHKDKLASIVRIGLPAGVQGMLFSISNIIIQSSVNGFGEIVMSGNAAAANLEGYVYVTMNSFHQAAVSFNGQNYGARRFDRIVRVSVTAELCVIVAGTVFGMSEAIFGGSLLWIYTTNEAAIQAGVIRLSFIAGTYALCGMQDVMVGLMRGLGYSILPMIVTLVGVCGSRLLWIFTVFQMPEYHKLEVLYFSYPMSWIITFIAHLICYIFVLQSVKNKLRADEALPDSFVASEEEK
ncbi:MAG: MATE family efflux transporter [Clostridia bacterium]|nr:MATE family efflux transporter [Clostridia bacterium]